MGRKTGRAITVPMRMTDILVVWVEGPQQGRVGLSADGSDEDFSGAASIPILPRESDVLMSTRLRPSSQRGVARSPGYKCATARALRKECAQPSRADILGAA